MAANFATAYGCQAKRPPRVLLLEKCSDHVDVAPAAEFGELTLMFERLKVSVFDTQRWEATIAERLAELNYNPAIDIVCMAGRMACMAVLCALVSRKYGAFDVLVFDAHEERYIRRTVGRQETVR
jgi:hypothetical protein